MPHLILHKVRGEPTFDVADKLDGTDIWIIPTSGHRAYPLETWGPLPERFNIAPLELYTDRKSWVELPDHYQIKAEPKPVEFNVGQLLSGLVKFKRRF